MRGKLVAVHLLKAPSVRQTFSPVASFPIQGDNRVEKISFQTGGALGDRALPAGDESDTAGVPPDKNSAVHLHLTPTPSSLGRVSINSSQYFDTVPQSAWEFFIGGYQPAQKWLKDRKGRVLSYDDTIHYKSIILALLETRRLMDAAEQKDGG